MTPKEALSEIINSTSGIWYKVSECQREQTYLRVTALRILNGTAKIETMEKFFDKIGYKVELNITKQNHE